MRGRAITQAVIIGAALAMIAYGVWGGEISAVLVKGSNICLECIGLG